MTHYKTIFTHIGRQIDHQTLLYVHTPILCTIWCDRAVGESSNLLQIEVDCQSCHEGVQSEKRTRNNKIQCRDMRAYALKKERNKDIVMSFKRPKWPIRRNT